MDFNVLRTAVFGVLNKLEAGVLAVTGNVFSSAFSIVSAGRAAAHGVVDVVIMPVRATLHAAERLTTEVIIFTFSVAYAVVTAVFGRLATRSGAGEEEGTDA